MEKGAWFLALLILIIIVISINSFKDEEKIMTFDECVDAGFPVMESYPMQCRDSDGNVFIEPLSSIPGSGDNTVINENDEDDDNDGINDSDETPDDNFVKNYCPEGSRNVDACIEIYQPVCGWNDPEKIVCITYPCAQTYSNSCKACQDENVLYYTSGECPKPQ